MISKNKVNANKSNSESKIANTDNTAKLFDTDDKISIIIKNIKTPYIYNFDVNPNLTLFYATTSMMLSFLMITLSMLILRFILITIKK